jgi:hypothetical protein
MERTRKEEIYMTLEEIEAKRTPNGGWTKETLKGWGVPWPPTKGWKQRLLGPRLFRPHRGSLADSMAEAHEVTSRQALVEEIIASFRRFGVNIPETDVIIEPYSYDARIGWDTWIVKVKGHGVEGFTNGPLT